MRPKKRQDVHSIDRYKVHTCTKFSSSHTRKSPIPCPLFTPLLIMNKDIKINVLVWFWHLESMGCTNEIKSKAPRCVLYQLICQSAHILTHTEVTNTMSTVYTTLDYDYRHINKSTDQVWYSRDVVCGIESMKISPITMNACAQEILILTCTEHASTTSPVDETQKYDDEH